MTREEVVKTLNMIAESPSEWAVNRTMPRFLLHVAHLIERQAKANEEMSSALSYFLDANAKAARFGGLSDSRDNTGQRFQSAWLEILLDKTASILAARAALKEG